MSILTKPLTKRKKQSPFKRLQSNDVLANRSKKFDREYFTEDNYKYQEWYLDQSKKIVTKIFENIRPNKDWVFLDVGCALGGIVEILRRRGFESYGIDLSRWCIAHSPVKQFLKFGSVTNLPCKDEVVDVTICIDMLQYLTKDELKIAAKELRRVTRKYLCLECITWEDEKFSDSKENPDAHRKHRSLLTKEELIELFEDAGFQLKKRRFLPRTIQGTAKDSEEHDDYEEYYEYDFSFNAIFQVR